MPELARRFYCKSRTEQAPRYIIRRKASALDTFSTLIYFALAIGGAVAIIAGGVHP